MAQSCWVRSSENSELRLRRDPSGWLGSVDCHGFRDLDPRFMCSTDTSEAAEHEPWPNDMYAAGASVPVRGLCVQGACACEVSSTLQHETLKYASGLHVDPGRRQQGEAAQNFR